MQSCLSTCSNRGAYTLYLFSLVCLSLLSWLEFQRGSEGLDVGGELGMSAKPAGPLYMFVCIITVFSESYLWRFCINTPSFFSLRLFPCSPPWLLSQLSLSPLSCFFCPAKRCLFYPASHRYSAKWLCFYHLKESFNIWMQTLLPTSSFFESHVQSFAFDTISIYFPPH